MGWKLWLHVFGEVLCCFQHSSAILCCQQQRASIPFPMSSPVLVIIYLWEGSHFDRCGYFFLQYWFALPWRLVMQASHTPLTICTSSLENHLWLFLSVSRFLLSWLNLFLLFYIAFVGVENWILGTVSFVFLMCLWFKSLLKNDLQYLLLFCKLPSLSPSICSTKFFVWHNPVYQFLLLLPMLLKSCLKNYNPDPCPKGFPGAVHLFVLFL